jgi:outer membrane protein OmpA-like peptidoglycan-associated protein
MKRSSWRILAVGALCALAAPASAQVVIGGSGSPSVEVNWSVLDSLGRQPTLADMLKQDVPASEARAALKEPKGVKYKPYKAGAQPYKGHSTKQAHAPKHAAAKPKSSVKQASAKSDDLSQLVQSSHKAPEAPKPASAPQQAAASQDDVKPVEVPRSSAQPAIPAKPTLPLPPESAKPSALPGPQVALPEMPKPAAAKIEAPVQLVKAEAAAPAAPKVELPPTALTPPPMPAAAKIEPVQQQVASLAPAPAAAAPSKGGDTLSVAFATDSARLPDAMLPELDKLVKRMQRDDSVGLQLLAYAEGDDANASKARRLSLSRALEVRKYLMEQGLRSTRIEVRALGNKIEGAGPADRVDAVLVGR